MDCGQQGVGVVRLSSRKMPEYVLVKGGLGLWGLKAVGNA